eukprot:gene32994-39907_t
MVHLFLWKCILCLLAFTEVAGAVDKALEEGEQASLRAPRGPTRPHHLQGHINLADPSSARHSVHNGHGRRPHLAHPKPKPDPGQGEFVPREGEINWGWVGSYTAQQRREKARGIGFAKDIELSSMLDVCPEVAKATAHMQSPSQTFRLIQINATIPSYKLLLYPLGEVAALGEQHNASMCMSFTRPENLGAVEVKAQAGRIKCQYPVTSINLGTYITVDHKASFANRFLLLLLDLEAYEPPVLKTLQGVLADKSLRPRFIVLEFDCPRWIRFNKLKNCTEVTDLVLGHGYKAVWPPTAAEDFEGFAYHNKQPRSRDNNVIFQAPL